MMRIALIFLLSFVGSSGQASVPDELFSALTGLFWCMNKHLPTDIEQLNKDLGFQLPPTATQANYKEWLNTVQLAVENDELVVIRQSGNQRESSKVDCESASF